MRISADSKHPDYSHASIHAKVYLDDVAISHCVTADEEAGTAECYMLHGAGHVVVNGNGDAQFETLRGKVRIDLSDCKLPVDIIGHDAWMRARSDAASAAGIAYN